MSNFPIVNAADANPVNANAQQQVVNPVLGALGPASRFGDMFEQAFVFGTSGSLKVDKDHIDLMEAFCNDPVLGFFVGFANGFSLPQLKFKRQAFQDTQTMFDNKVLAAQYYGVCYTAYKKFCDTANRRMAAGLLPPQVVRATPVVGL